MDRGYTGYRLFEAWTRERLGLGTRLKNNAEYFVVA
jgi:hypothetical protein